MARRTDAYVDTSAFIAFADRSDSHHSLFRRLFAKPPRLVTTVLVVAEGHGWFLRRFDPLRAREWIGFVESLECLEILPVGALDLAAGATVLRRFADQRLTLVDAVGISLMRSRRVASCWSTDFHLGLDGAPLVIDQH